MKLCVVSLGGESSKSIAQEAKKFFDEVTEVSIKSIRLCLEDKGVSVKNGGVDLEDFDCIYVRGSYRYLLLQRALTKALYKKIYMPIRPNAFTLGHNKLLASLELLQKGINIPTSYFVSSSEQAKQLLSEVQYPIIIKIPEGTQGKGVMFADSESSARSMIDALEVFKQPYIIQEYIETGDVKSQDIRVIVAGGKVVGCFKRISSSHDIRSNIHMGGKGEVIDLPPEIEKMSIRAVRALGADIAAVDVLVGRKPSVLEINLSPGLKGITKYTGENIAERIAKALYDGTVEFKKNNGLEKTIHEKDSSSKEYDEHYIESNIEKGIMQLPKFVTRGTGFNNGDDLIVKIKKGELKVLRHNIRKDDD